MSSHLVDTDWLAAHLDDPQVRIFDCTVRLVPDAQTTYRAESGRFKYDQGHIPGAGFLDLIDELSEPSSAQRFTLPSAERFAQAVARHGVSDDTQVVLYATREYWWATRLWWMFRVFGCDRARVLDGGWQKWAAEGRPQSSEPPRHGPGRFTPAFRPRLVAGRDEVLAAIADGAVCVVNALSPETHQGTGDLVYHGRRGHIAGSVNVYGMHLVHPETNTLRPRDELRATFEAVGALSRPRVITYCGGGIAATGDAFALDLLGHPDVAVYDASLQEWAADPALPMVMGE